MVTLMVNPLAFVGLFVALIAVALAIVAARRARAQGLSGRTEGYHWLFYSNAGDRRLWVPKRYGIGWTVNFGHPWAWPTTLLLVGLGVVSYVVSRHGR
ncbi:MAG: DUF5808 domain-containing protein [Polyangiaceae bacterium]|jgi:uncharacterized membrane protein